MTKFNTHPSLPFDPLTATAEDVSQGLKAGNFTSEDLVHIYLSRIEKYNGHLKALISTAPKEKLLEAARKLDQERRKGKLRGREGRLHGVPIIVKDCIDTDPKYGMDTTGGSFAFVGARPKGNAVVVQQLVDAGMLILGKANLSEFAGIKSTNITCGWSAVGGQTLSPYIKGGLLADDAPSGHNNPSGSSSGSATSVSAGFGPVSLGTETGGSIIMPANRQALYAIKPTATAISKQGVMPVVTFADSLGPMSKTPLDLANLLDVIIDPKVSRVPKDGYTSVLNGSWSDISIAVVRPEEYHLKEDFCNRRKGVEEQMEEDTHTAYDIIEPLAKKFVRYVHLPNYDEMEYEGINFLSRIIEGHVKKYFDEYIASLDNCKIKNLRELVQFNKDHADIELPPGNDNQDWLEKFLADKSTPEQQAEYLAFARKLGRTEGVDKIMKDHGVDVILAPSECSITFVSSASGYPLSTMPLGYLRYNGAPFGMSAITTAGGEDILVKVMGAWEKTFGPRRVPDISNFVRERSFEI